MAPGNISSPEPNDNVLWWRLACHTLQKHIHRNTLIIVTVTSLQILLQSRSSLSSVYKNVCIRTFY